ncbi:unnamed protein product, partial [Pocillopora meandrina]
FLQNSKDFSSVCAAETKMEVPKTVFILVAMIISAAIRPKKFKRARFEMIYDQPWKGVFMKAGIKPPRNRIEDIATEALDGLLFTVLGCLDNQTLFFLS